MVETKEQNSNILIIKSSTQNERISLIPGKEYVLGRSDRADIPIEDKKASRKHAILRYSNSSWQISDNESTNGLYSGSRKVGQAILSSDEPCRIGSTQVFIESPVKKPIARSETKTAALASVPSETAKRPAWFLPVLIALLVVLLLFICVVVYLPDGSQGDKVAPKGVLVITPPEKRVVSSPQIEKEVPLPVQAVKKGSDTLSSDKARAREHYRNGLLFYDSGHLKRAIDEWDLAQTYDDSNTLIIKKLARAIKDLDYEISRHYKDAKSHYKYLRFYEAEQSFMIVTELSHDKNDERYLDSLNKLELIRKEIQ